MSSLFWLSDTDGPTGFPPVSQALTEPDGLLAAGGVLTPQRLLAAYQRGIFPWYSHSQPILWWSPDPRAVVFPEEFRLSRSLRKRIRNSGFETRLDENFPAVIRECAAPRAIADGTWLTPEMIAAYTELFALGHGHSIETWHAGRLVGGLYGIQLGRVFFGESMFSRESDASKVALARLVAEARARGIVLIDCQIASPHLESLGSRLIPRADFIAILREHCEPIVPGRWI